MPLTKKPRYFLGVTLGRRTGWETFFSEVKATRSSKPESVKKEIADKTAKREETAHFQPIGGTVSQVVIIDDAGKEVLVRSAGFDSVQGEVSASALGSLASLLEDGLLADNPTLHDVQVRLFGLRIRERLRIMALDALRYQHTAKVEVAVDLPVGLWYHRPFEPSPWCDPYEAAIPSELRSDVPFDGLCDFLGIPLPQGADVDTDARLQAELARQIAIKTQLFPQ